MKPTKVAIPPSRDPANKTTIEPMRTAVDLLQRVVGEVGQSAVRVFELVNLGVVEIGPDGSIQRKTVTRAPGQNIVSHVQVFGSSLAVQTVNVPIPAGTFLATPQIAFIQQADGAEHMLGSYVTGNSSPTNAQFSVRRGDNAAFSGARRFSVFLQEY